MEWGMVVSIPYRLNEIELGITGSSSLTDVSIPYRLNEIFSIIGIMAATFIVSIPYRLNEIFYSCYQGRECCVFQFLIGSMKSVNVSAYSPLSEFQFLIGSMKFV